jgi:L-seryl-tRNA(Ser) seleniumtransferase
MLPEVRAAMAAASQHYVHLDELAEAIGARLATLTGAEWGLVTSGCSAALTHATAACVAGGNPDLHIRIPNLNGFAKDEVIIPKHSRNVYDAALRGVGVRVIEVTTPAELEAALGPRTALIYILASPEADESALPTKLVASIAQPRGVPVLVDAAAEILTVPNVHLQNGATLVGYSGGKCLRGPQAAGLLLGRKDLVKAAWVHSAPHHGYSRGYKVGKEEAIGMLMAVEMWMKRDHDAEWKMWTSWLDSVAKRVSAVPGVTTAVVQPKGLSNRMPSLRVFWDRKQFGLAGDAAARTLYEGDPRVGVFAARHDSNPALTGVSVNPYMMAAGDEKIVADKLVALLSNPPHKDDAPAPAAAGRRPERPVGREGRIRGGHVQPRPQPAPARQRPRRFPSRRLPLPRPHGHDRRRQREDPQLPGRAERRLHRLQLHGQGVRRRDGRDPGHGRIPGRQVVGAAAHRAAGLSP